MCDILVCVKPVPLRNNIGMQESEQPNLRQGALGLTPADASAVEAALAYPGDNRVSILSMGPEKSENLLRDLLERGADQAYLLSDMKMAGSDTYATAVVLAAGVKKLGPFDLILCGRKSTDGETGQVPGELAGLLDWPCVMNVMRMNVAQTEELEQSLYCRVQREGAVAELEVKLPAVVALCEYSYILRLPSIRSKRKATVKTVERISLDDLEISQEYIGLAGSRTRVIKTNRMDMRTEKCPQETDLLRATEQVALEIRKIRT